MRPQQMTQNLIFALAGLMLLLQPAQALTEGEVPVSPESQATVAALETSGSNLFWSRVRALDSRLERLQPSNSAAREQHQELERNLEELTRDAYGRDSLEPLQPFLSRLEDLTERLYRWVEHEEIPLGAPLYQPI